MKSNGGVERGEKCGSERRKKKCIFLLLLVNGKE